MAVYGILVSRARSSPALYSYHRDRVFHRVAEPKNAGMSVDPPHATLLLFEVMCQPGDEHHLGTSAAWQKVIADAEAESLLISSEILHRHHQIAPDAYPVFELGFEEYLETANRWLDSFPKLRSTGRQGAFTYPNMHTAMRMGESAATSLLAP